jgi:hypothetical protein
MSHYTTTTRSNLTEFDLPTNAYTSFDAQSMRDLIISRLNADSTINFTDQNFEGSNVSALIDILAYTYHTLLFYLNQTSAESNFADAELYENVNRIVKLIGYKPLGSQTCILPIDVTGKAALSKGYYTIPKFTFTAGSGQTFTVIQDITFEKTLTTAETVSPVGNTLMYEGNIEEYPALFPIGEKYETIFLNPGGDVLIDHFNIFVFVKEVNERNKWYEWNRTPSLFLSKPNDRQFEVTYNENKKYELKFGNSINGKKLNLGDTVAIYYLKSSGTRGKVTKNTLNGSAINIYNTSQYDQIFADIKDTSLNYMSISASPNITITNTQDSTEFGEPETASEIKQNAPRFFSSEYRLTTKADYKSFIQRNYKNFVYDCTVLNNSDYTNDYLRYINDELGLTDYTKDTNALLNQYYYADSADSNNIYLTVVPKLRKEKSVVTRSNYLPPSLKEKIQVEIENYKLLNSEISFLDPVYLSVDLSLKAGSEQSNVGYKNTTELRLRREARSLINESNLKSKVFNIISSYIKKLKLGGTINVRDLNNEIEGIPGLVDFKTTRTDTGVEIPGLSLCIFNPIYNGKDLKFIDTTLKLKPYQIPYIENEIAFRNKIKVISALESKAIQEY